MSTDTWDFEASDAVLGHTRAGQGVLGKQRVILHQVLKTASLYCALLFSAGCCHF